LRGGSFNNNDNNLHASNRNNNNPTNENNNIGFRVSEAPETQAAFVFWKKPAARSARVGKARAAAPCSGTTRPSGVPVTNGQAKKKVRPRRVAARRKARPGRFLGRRYRDVTVFFRAVGQSSPPVSAGFSSDFVPIVTHA